MEILSFDKGQLGRDVNVGYEIRGNETWLCSPGVITKL